MNGLSFILRNFNTLNSGQLQRAFTGVSIDEVRDSVHGIWNVVVERNDNRGSGVVKVYSDNQSFTVDFNPGADYPDVIAGDGIIMVDATVKNGRIISSSIDKDDPNLDTLPNPRIDTNGLSKKEIDAIKEELRSGYNLFVDGHKYIELMYVVDSDNLSTLNKYANRIYYPTVSDDTKFKQRDSKEIHQRKQDKEIEDPMPVGSVEAVKIMSETPVYINKTLVDSLPKVTDPYSMDTTSDVLNQIDRKSFDGIKSAYSSEGIQEILYDPEFVSSYKRGDMKSMRNILGLQKEDKLSESMEVLFGINLYEFGKMLEVAEDPIQTEDGYINVFNNENVNSLSEALTLSDEYLRFNDVYDAKYNMFTSRGERMYAEDIDNFQSNKEIRKNIRFDKNNDIEIDSSLYFNNMLESLGGSLVEDKLVTSDKHKFTREELITIASEYLENGSDKEPTPRIQNYLNSIDEFNKSGEIDTQSSVTMDATFSGLVVNSAITGKTQNIGKVNVLKEGEQHGDSLRDLYSEVGEPLIDKLLEHGIDHKEARSLVKPAVMTAMYNSSSSARTQQFYKEAREALTAKYGRKEAQDILETLNEEVKESVNSATEVLASVVKEEEILSLVDKGIISVYKQGDVGEPVKFTPTSKEDLYQVAGVQIRKPDGTSSVIVNGEDEIIFKDDKLLVEKDDHVIPFTQVTRVKDGKLSVETNQKKLLDNVSTAIARTYDSYVASYVVEKMHDEGIPVLTTHDAFTVPVYAMNKAKDYYNEAVNNIYKFGGSDIVVDARDNLSVE